MDTKIINIIAPGMFGGTFLDWSLHYLAGHTHIYSYDYLHGIETFKKRQLTNNPNTNINAHAHCRNHSVGSHEFQQLYNLLSSTQSANFHTIYATFSFISDDTKYNCEVDEIWKIASNSQYNVVLALPEISKNYLLLDTAKKRDNNKVDLFATENNEWIGIGLIDIWDRREMLALNKRPFRGKTCKINTSPQHTIINPLDLFSTFEYTVERILHTLDIDIKHNRLPHWKDVYYQWKKIHYMDVQWVFYFDQIIEYIINGYHMDLSRFELNLNQEASIQHVLIYKYDLNLKTWGLEKFPNNTKKLHELLEPNIHKITQYNQ